MIQGLRGSRSDSESLDAARLITYSNLNIESLIGIVRVAIERIEKCHLPGGRYHGEVDIIVDLIMELRYQG